MLSSFDGLVKALNLDHPMRLTSTHENRYRSGGVESVEHDARVLDAEAGIHCVWKRL